MITRTTKFFLAAVVATALIATVAIARTHQARGPMGNAVQTQTDSHAVNAAVRVPQIQATQPQPHANFSCAAAIEQDCQKLDWWPE